MKKIALLLFLFVTLQISAQEVHFLPKVGLNLATMTNSDGGNMKPGLNIGVAAEFLINPQFAIEPGIYYSMQGIKVSEFKNDYLNIPIYAKAYLYEGLYAFAGPQFGFLVGSKISASEGKVSGSVKTKDLYNKVDVALGLGLGYQFSSGLLVSMNYNIGLTNILSDDGMNLGGENINWGGEKSRNGVLQINLGWKF